jgi:hypothetical protein
MWHLESYPARGCAQDVRDIPYSTTPLVCCLCRAATVAVAAAIATRAAAVAIAVGRRP